MFHNLVCRWRGMVGWAISLISNLYWCDQWSVTILLCYVHKQRCTWIDLSFALLHDSFYVRVIRPFTVSKFARGGIDPFLGSLPPRFSCLPQSTWFMNGFFSCSTNCSGILISITPSDFGYHSSTFKQRLSKTSTILARSPTTSSTSTSLHSTGMIFLSFSALGCPTITPHCPSLFQQGFLLWMSAKTICKEDIRVPPSFLLMVGIKPGFYSEKIAKLFMWWINVSFSFLVNSFPNTTSKSSIGTTVKLVFLHQSPSFNGMSLATPTTLSTPAFTVLKVVYVGSSCNPILHTMFPSRSYESPHFPPWLSLTSRWVLPTHRKASSCLSSCS